MMGDRHVPIRLPLQESRQSLHHKIFVAESIASVPLVLTIRTLQTLCERTSHLQSKHIINSVETLFYMDSSAPESLRVLQARLLCRNRISLYFFAFSDPLPGAKQFLAVCPIPLQLVHLGFALPGGFVDDVSSVLLELMFNASFVEFDDSIAFHSYRCPLR